MGVSTSPSISYSELQTFRQCPLKWHAQYVLRLSPPTEKPALRFGTAWHSLLEGHYQVLKEWQDRPSRPGHDTLVKMCREGARAQLATNCARDGDLDGEQMDTLRWMYEGYLQTYDLDPDWTILAVEAGGRVPLIAKGAERVDLKYRADLIVQDRRHGNIWIVDFKTAKGKDASGAYHQRDMELDDQFGLYQGAISMLLPVKQRLDVFGCVYARSRTDRLKRDMTLEERHGRHPTFRSDIEIEAVLQDARRTWQAMRAARRDYERTGREPYSAPEPEGTCFPAGTRVSTAGTQRVTRRRYVGPLHTIETAGGVQLSATTNHPILTDRGWVAAHKIREGDRIVRRDGLRYLDSRERPHPEQSIPIEDLFESFRAAGGVLQRVDASAVDLHGETPDHEVEVVSADRDLAAVRDAESIEVGGEFVFPAADSCASIAAGLAVESLLSDHCIGPGELGPAVSAERQALLSRPVGRRDPVGFGGWARTDTVLAQDTVDDAARYAVRVSEAQHRLTSEETLDEVILVREHEFDGHVYNLETEQGWYLAESTTVMNCKWRCDALQGHLNARRQGADLGPTLVRMGWDSPQWFKDQQAAETEATK